MTSGIVEAQQNGNGSSTGSNGQEESKTNLIVNYLPQTMTQEEIRLLFSRYPGLFKIMKNFYLFKHMIDF